VPDRESLPAKDRLSTTVPRNQQVIAASDYYRGEYYSNGPKGLVFAWGLVRLGSRLRFKVRDRPFGIAALRNNGLELPRTCVVLKIKHCVM